MDSQDQRKTGTDHENHGVYECRKCGWPFPNSHPSARHRRAHKRICGTIEGYKLTDSEKLTKSSDSDDEHHSEDEPVTPSLDVEKKMIKEMGSGGVEERSNRSGDELFSDAVAEFSESGFSPGSDERLDADRQLLKVDLTTGSSQTPNVEVLERETNHSGSATQFKDIASKSTTESSSAQDITIEQVAPELSNINGSSSDSSHTKSDIPLGNEPGQNEDNNLCQTLSDVGESAEPAVAVQVESDSARDRDIVGDGGLLEVRDREGERNEDMHVVSVASDLLAIDRSDITLEDFKDHKEVKSDLQISVEDSNTCVKLEERSNLSSEVKHNRIEDVPIECEAENTSEVKVTNGEEDLASSGKEAETVEVKIASCEDLGGSRCIEVPLGTMKTGMEETQRNPFEGPEPRDFDYDLTQDSKEDLSNLIPIRTSGEEEKINPTTSFTGRETMIDQDMDRAEGIMEEKLQENTKSPPDQTIHLLGEDDNCDSVKGQIALPQKLENDSTESAIEAECGRKIETTLESECQFTETHRADEATTNLKETESMDIEKISDSGEGGTFSMLSSYSSSQNCENRNSKIVNADIELSRNVDDEFLKESSETPNLKEPEPSSVDSESIIKSSEPSLQEEGDDNHTKQLRSISAVDALVDSSSQTDSLEGNWGSVSVLSTQSDAPVAIDNEAFQSERSNLPRSKPEPLGHRTDQSDTFEAPSFMTLVQPGGGSRPEAANSEIQTPENTKDPDSEALKAAWFPSITNVVNESQGRKKNEDIIAKVTNWSTEKQTTPFKSLLAEAKLETEPLKSPKPKQTPNAIRSDGTENSILGAQSKREKSKGRPYWLQFVCCSSVN